MPFIEEEKYALMQEDLDNSRLEKEQAEEDLGKTEEEFVSFKKKSMVLPIILGIMLGLSLGAAFYFYNNNAANSPSDEDIAQIKKTENERVLDSIKRANARANRKSKAGVNNKNIATTINQVKETTKGLTIYSVQIGVISEKDFPLLASQTIPSTVTSSDEYFKYSLGLYTNLQEAKDLRDEFIKIGFEDAFVASYIDGKRQKIHD